MLTKILLPVDFSDSGQASIAQARELALRTGAELVVLHVDELPIAPPPDDVTYVPAHVVEQRQEKARQRLEAVVRDLQRAGVHARGCCQIGPVYGTIMEVARAEAPELIVMGTHGRRGLAHMVLGSVAERVVRASPIPVLTVKATGTAARKAGGA